jgi:hypothetical protein
MSFSRCAIRLDNSQAVEAEAWPLSLRRKKQLEFHHFTRSENHSDFSLAGLSTQLDNPQVT